jgi:hypothetical protein
MGCTESVPVSNAFEKVHNVNPSIPMLGKEQGAGPSLHSSLQLIVREKLFTWSGDDFKIKMRGGAPFGNNLKMKGKVFGLRDQMVLLDGNNIPVAVCLRRLELVGQTFKIYSTRPLYPDQRPSDRKYNQYVLYTYAKVERIPLSTVQQVTFDNESSPSYMVYRAGGLWPKRRVVKLHGRPAALMEGGTWEGNHNSYLLTVNPGIDPCLIVCLSAICDEMDEGRN